MIRIKRREQEIPMASMSDIAFLLIIFFIITISFLYKQGLKISLPKKDSKPVVVQASDLLILKLDQNGNLYQNNQKILLTEINVKQQKVVIIQINKMCSYKYLVYLIEQLQKNNISKISIKSI